MHFKSECIFDLLNLQQVGVMTIMVGNRLMIKELLVQILNILPFGCFYIIHIFSVPHEAQISLQPPPSTCYDHMGNGLTCQELRGQIPSLCYFPAGVDLCPSMCGRCGKESDN